MLHVAKPGFIMSNKAIQTFDKHMLLFFSQDTSSKSSSTYLQFSAVEVSMLAVEVVHAITMPAGWWKEIV